MDRPSGFTDPLAIFSIGGPFGPSGSGLRSRVRGFNQHMQRMGQDPSAMLAYGGMEDDESDDGDTITEEDDTTSTDADTTEVGMDCSIKNLYSGKEDKRGRFHWREKIPKDVGKPVENAQTAKFALLVRNVKVYNDPRKVLGIHSIVVQSPLLKKLLDEVLEGYPGISTKLDRMEFSGKFEPLIHRWSELQKAVAALDDEKDALTKQHAGLLMDLLQNEFKDVISVSQDHRLQGVMTYELLWTLFQPASFACTRQDGQDQVIKVIKGYYGFDRNDKPCFWLRGQYIEWDGTKFGFSKLNLQIPSYDGTRKITSLTAYPIGYHNDSDSLVAKLTERGEKVESLAGTHYKTYNGMTWKWTVNGFGQPTKDKYHVKGRIVIDSLGWNRFNPNQAISVTPLSGREPAASGHKVAHAHIDDDTDLDPEDDYGMPMDGAFGDEDDNKRQPLTAEQKLMCSPLLRGYSLQSKMWLNFFVPAVHDIEFSAAAFDRLVLPANHKELILSFTETQKSHKDAFDDVIEGKGKGIILLLCGPPGVGKTLTAESIAEEMKVPLYSMSAGDLGVDPRHLEGKLQNILEMCQKWNAILLIDEADVFLEQRHLHELERNKLVSIFLRVLEYYEGIMFLTTNRVETFDAAFQSRIHISLDYPDLTQESRHVIWTNFLAALPVEHSITPQQVKELSRKQLNGRQIKNVIKTAQLLARRKEVPLNHEHVLTVLDVMHLHTATETTKHAQSSIFN